MVRKHSISYFAISGILLFFWCAACAPAATDEPEAAPEATAEEPEAFPALAPADSLFAAGDFAAAARQYHSAARDLAARGSYRAAVRAITQQGISRQQTGDYQAADSILAEAIALGEVHLDTLRDTLLADALHKRGIGHYMNDDNAQALNFFLRALRIREAGLPPDHPDLINSYYVTGATYRYLNRYEDALALLQQAIRQHGEKPTAIMPLSYRMMADIYDQQGDLFQAVQYLNSALVVCETHFPENISRIVSLHNDLAIDYADLDQPEEAVRHARAALDLYCRHTAANDREIPRLANYYNTLANAYNRHDQPGQALVYYDSALLLLQRAPEIDSNQTAQLLNNLGVLYKNRGQYNRALGYLHRSINLNVATGSRMALAANYHNAGEVWAERQLTDSALIYQQEALGLLIPGHQQKTAIPALSAIVSEHLDALLFADALAGVYLQRQDLFQALTLYDSLDALIDRVRYSFLADDSKISLVEKTKPIYERAIDVCVDLYRQTGERNYLEKAFGFSEKSKAIVLLEAIKESKARMFGIDAGKLKEEQELKTAIAECEKQLFNAQNEALPDSTRLSRLNEERIRLQQRYAAFIADLEQQAPEYYRLKYNTRPLRPQDIQADPELLAAGQAVVAFFRGERRLYRFLITPGECRIDTLDAGFPLEVRIADFRGAIDAYLTGSGSRCQEFLQSSWELFDLLLADVYSQLPEHLIIVPDGVLGLLPFDALLTQPPREADCRNLGGQPYLLRDHSLSYCYSATLLREMKNNASGGGLRDQVLAFAPEFPGQQNAPAPAAGIRGLTGPANAGLPPLLFNGEEVKAIARIVSTRTVSGLTADKDHFVAAAPRHRFLHIATHGVADDENPDFSFIAFSQPADSLDREELLFVRELYDLHLPADMVVLSACETGIGRIAKGEGIVSLARGFSYAGVGSIVTTLWSISDQQSNALLEAFYRHLRGGQPKDEALRQAKLDYMAQNPAFAHPYYWAAFIPIGNMEKVDIPGPGIHRGWWLAAALAMVAAGLGWQIRRNRKNPGFQDNRKVQSLP